MSKLNKIKSIGDHLKLIEVDKMFSSQYGQDKFLEEKIFKGLENGFFVDVGAHDGIWYSNSYFFETHRKWRGICVEPFPELFEKLKLNRPDAVNLNLAVDRKEGETEFIASDAQALSGIKEHYDPRHLQRLLNESNVKEQEKLNVIKVQTKRLESILEEQKITRVNYLSIDVEGAEQAVVESIDFDKVFIDVIGLENNYPDKTDPITRHLISKGYRPIEYIGCDIIFISEKSEFFKEED